MRRLLIISFLLTSVTLCMGQRDQQRGSGNDPQSQRDSSTLRQLSDSLVIQAIDTLSNDIFAFTLDNLSERVLVNDTTLNQFEEYELTRGAWKRYSTLGNTGSSAHGTFWNPRYSDQFELGFNQHDPYKFKDEDIRYYKIEKPFSSVYFNPGETQSSFTSKAQLIRDFANGVSVSLNFNRINSQPYYQKQEVRHTSMQVGYFHKIDSSRFAYAINFRSNSNFEMYNGGITDRTLFDSTAFQFAELLPVNSEDEYSYQLSRDYSARVYYFLQDKKKSKQYLQLKVNHDRGLYKYINESVSEYDSITYTAEFTDFELGMRYPINVNKTAARLSYHLENNLLRSFYYVRYGLNQVRNDLGNQNISELVGGAENSFDWRGLNVNLDGYVGTVYNSFLLDLHPSAGYNYRDKAAINFGFRLHTQPSAYSVNQVAISFASIRDEDPFVVSSQELYGEVDVPLVGFKGRISSYTGQNVPVLDSTGTEFLRENITYLQVDLEEKISYKWFHFNNRFSTQIRSNEVYDMPLWYTEHELYFEGKLFEALEFQSGFNLDFVPSASLPSYSPLYGRFYNSNNPDEGFFYRLDTYAAIKVQGFRFFVKYENLNDLWQSASDKIYQVRDYPQFDGRLRLGVSWELRN